MPHPGRCNAGRTSNVLRDHVYRAMLQVEVGKPGAARSLCGALQRAWLASRSIDSSDQIREWLGKVTPLCLSMLADRARIEAPDTRGQPQIANRLKERKPGMQIQVTQLDGVGFAISTRNHTVISDQPEDNGGHDTGMTPPELLLASLGSCAAFYAFQYLKTRKLADSGVEVSVTAEKLKQPSRMGNFQIEVTCPVSLSEEQTQGMLRSVHQCLVHNTRIAARDSDPSDDEGGDTGSVVALRVVDEGKRTYYAGAARSLRNSASMRRRSVSPSYLSRITPLRSMRNVMGTPRTPPYCSASFASPMMIG